MFLLIHKLSKSDMNWLQGIFLKNMKYIGNIGIVRILLSKVCISWRSVLLVEETGVPGENRRPVANLWQSLSHMVYIVHFAWTGFELTTSVVIGTEYTGSCKFNHHTITMTMVPNINRNKWSFKFSLAILFGILSCLCRCLGSAIKTTKSAMLDGSFRFHHL